MSDPIDREWPTVVFAKDEEEPEERFARLTVLTMGELSRRLERLGARVAASLNRLPATDRPLLAIEATPGPALPKKFYDLDGGSFYVVQRDLVWHPDVHAREEFADAYALTQSLETPAWSAGARLYDVPPLAVVGHQYFVLQLPRQLDPRLGVTLHAGHADGKVEVPADVVTHPPHPLLWWGTPPAGFEA